MFVCRNYIKRLYASACLDFLLLLKLYTLYSERRWESNSAYVPREASLEQDPLPRLDPLQDELLGGPALTLTQRQALQQQKYQIFLKLTYLHTYKRALKR